MPFSLSFSVSCARLPGLTTNSKSGFSPEWPELHTRHGAPPAHTERTTNYARGKIWATIWGLALPSIFKCAAVAAAAAGCLSFSSARLGR